MKIVVLDGYTVNPGDLSWEGLAALGELTVYDRTPPNDEEEIIRRIGDAELVFTNKTSVTRRVMEACPRMRFLGVLSTGYNTVDVDCARERGIPICNVPGYGTASVSQFSIALLLELCHHIGHHDQTVHQGRWEKSEDFCYWDYPLIELDGKTLGIIGFGRIGRQEGRVARALGMEVIAFDPHPCDEGRSIAEYVALEELYRRADVVSLHCNLTAENAGMIDRAAIAQMKDGVLLINNARGGLINEQDLADALNSGKVAGAGLDVVSTEPIRRDNPLLRAKNCIITPHISWGARESRARILECAAENLKAFLAGAPQNVVDG